MRGWGELARGLDQRRGGASERLQGWRYGGGGAGDLRWVEMGVGLQERWGWD
jgi:hypothetical protein